MLPIPSPVCRPAQHLQGSEPLGAESPLRQAAEQCSHPKLMFSRFQQRMQRECKTARKSLLRAWLPPFSSQVARSPRSFNNNQAQRNRAEQGKAEGRRGDHVQLTSPPQLFKRVEVHPDSRSFCDEHLCDCESQSRYHRTCGGEESRTVLTFCADSPSKFEYMHRHFFAPVMHAPGVPLEVFE